MLHFDDAISLQTPNISTPPSSAVKSPTPLKHFFSVKKATAESKTRASKMKSEALSSKPLSRLSKYDFDKPGFKLNQNFDPFSLINEVKTDQKQESSTLPSHYDNFDTVFYTPKVSDNKMNNIIER